MLNLFPVPPFGEMLKKYRLSRGLTIEQVAAALQLAPSAVRTVSDPTASTRGL